MTKQDATSAAVSPMAPIAVVGVSALFPGSSDAGGFWRDILAGRDLLSDVPNGHWRIADYYDPDPSAADKTYAKRGGFLDPIDFDALDWGVPPSMLSATDTSQLLALIVARSVLEDAAREQFEQMDRSRMSVILGVTSAQELLFSMVSRLQRPVWVKALREAGIAEDQVQQACQRIADHYVPWQEASFPGLLGNVVAGRIANRLNLGGTNCVTDAACASSFSAVAMAVNELQLRQSDLVIAGGVDTLNDIFMYMCFSKTPALSPSGDCRPFSDQADGTMLGEGLGMVALKRLDDAERDGDRIYAVLRGVGTSSDGRSKSVYAPVSAGQAQALRRAYAQAGFSADTIELVEAHGTGTKAGDAAEFGGLQMVYGEADSERQQWCALGSVKSQIGHTKAAAGAAGLFKLVMALHHKVLPPTIKIDSPNPALQVESSPFYLNTQARPWIRGGDHPRRAAVSAFGFGGSNFHLALEEYTGDAPRAERLATQPADLLLLCADSVEALLADLDSLTSADQPLATLAAKSRADWRSDAGYRLALVANDAEQLARQLSAARKRIQDQPEQPFSLPDGSSYGIGADAGALALLFPGQGSQYVGMGADLAMQFDAARAAWDEAADAPVAGTEAVHQRVFPRPVFDAESAAAQTRALTQTEWTQPALAAHSASLLAVLEQLGVRADMVAGHSFGELMALHAAGAYDRGTAYALARARGAAMAEVAAQPGAMSAISAPVDQVQSLLSELDQAPVIANHNGPNQVVVSGPLKAVEALESRLTEADLGFRRLPVSNAFHSELVSAASGSFRAALKPIRIPGLTVPVYANSTAEPYPDSCPAICAQLAEQLAKPVQFVAMIEAMYAAGARTFVEVGPGSVLSGLVSTILGDRPHRVVPLDHKSKHGVTSLLRGLAQLAAAGVPFQPDALFADVRLPTPPSKAKMAVAINGSNYGKPYPPPADQPLPPPNPAPKVQSTAKSPPTEAPKPAVAVNPQPAPVPRPAATSSLSPQPSALSPQPMPKISSDWLAAFQDSQQQAAQAHQAFQQAMSDSHNAYLRLTESALQGLSAAIGGGADASASVLPTAPAEVSAPPPRTEAPAVAAPPATSRNAAFSTTMSAVALDAEGPRAQGPGPRKSEAASQGRDEAPLSPQPSALSPSPTNEGHRAQGTGPRNTDEAPLGPGPSTLGPLLLEVVAEKTGFPPDMLNLDMDLEADLGVDSIKRVEILATLDERAPNLPKVDRSRLTALHTLAEIIEYLKVASASSPTPAHDPNEATVSPLPPTLSPSPNQVPDLPGLLLDVVAEKTGFPQDMLNLDMDLEADLGVDSIKRVEILATLDERAPNLPKVDRSRLTALHTLAEIIEYLSAAEAAEGHGAQSEGQRAQGPGPSNSDEAPLGPGPSALGPLLLEVVAEKTGFPPDMLNLDMDLEADLGVDSIKRVEILATLDERAPDLPKVDRSRLTALHTLAEIIDHLSVAAGASRAAETGNEAPLSPQPSALSPSPSPNQGQDLPALLLEVVAEKTGFPPDMLNLDMDLEADLGVDSIKRVEILATLDERAPDLPKVDRSRLTALHTLAEIIEYLSAAEAAEGHGAQSEGQRAQGPGPSNSDEAPLGPGPSALGPLLLEVVAEKTGFPPDMLNLDMDLEADLGVDSIKRVEILATLDERAPNLPKVDRSRLTALHTLAEIIDYLSSAGATQAAETHGEAPLSPQPSALSPSSSDEAPLGPGPSALGPHLGRYQTTLTPAPATGFAMPGLLNGSPLAIIGPAALSRALANALVARGVNAQACEELPATASGCVYLSGLSDPADSEVAMAINHRAFAIARELAPRLANDRGLFVCVQDSGGDFGLGGTAPDRAWLAGQPALIKTCALEWPQAALKAIDIARSRRDDKTLAEAIASELLGGGGEIEVALGADGSRHTLRSVEHAARPDSELIEAGDVVLVSGGGRGVTAACIKAWAERCPAHFVLLGRTELTAEPAVCDGLSNPAQIQQALLQQAKNDGERLTPAQLSARVSQVLAVREIHQTLTDIHNAGATASYVAAPVTDEDALATALAAVREQHGPIRAVVHAAGVLADKRIADKTDAQFAQVFDTKVRGLQALLDATADDPLKLLCVFSSVSARCGNTGQADYAMANEVLNKVVCAQAQQRPGLRVKALGWGPWEGGMVNPALRERFAELGVPMIPLATGAAMFADEMADASGAVELVLGGEPRPQALLSDGADARVDALELRVSKLSHDYLAGHAVNGQPVVPAVLVAEWLTRAARSFRPGSAVVALHDLRVLKGITLPGFENGGDLLRIEARPMAEGDGTQLAMQLVDSRNQPRYSARVELGDLDADAGEAPPELELEDWHGEPLYGDLLFHRGSFELIEQINGISDQGVRAQLRGVADAGWPADDWQLDVAALDGGMQLAVLYGRRMLGGANLPTQIAQLRRYRPAANGGPITATAYSREVGRHATTTDIVLTDASGQRLVELLGVRNHALPAA